MKLLVAMTALITVLGMTHTHAQPDPTHAEAADATGQSDHHEPLATSASLTLASLLDTTFGRHHDLGVVNATADYGAAWQGQSRSLISGAPAFSQRYQTDRAQDDNGLEEFESGLALPLWRIGERRNARALGQAISADAVAAARELRWRLAGELRTLLWDLAKARSRLALAQESLAQSLELERAITRQAELGDLPRAHRVLAGMEVLDARSAVTRSQAEAVDLAVEYRVLTGMNLVPDLDAIAEDPAPTPPEAHPFLETAMAGLERATREARAEAYRARGAPHLLIGPRWEQSRRDEVTEESIGLTLTVPLAVGAAGRLAESAAALAVAAAQRELDRRRRAQQLALHEAEHRLSVARAFETEAAAAAELAAQNQGTMQAAFAAGEIEFAEYLRARRLAREYRLAADLARLEVQQAIALQNQAQGVMP